MSLGGWAQVCPLHSLLHRCLNRGPELPRALLRKIGKAELVMHGYNPSIQEAEAGGL
jgi:hypothetical protein